MRLSHVTDLVLAGLRFAFGFVVSLVVLTGAASADVPHPWQFGFQNAVTPVAHLQHQLHHLLLIIIIGITGFVLALLIYVMVRFNAKRNPQPSKTSHNTVVEVLWTVLPVMILVIIAIPSFKLLYFMDKAQNPELTLKVTGHQWYWSYTYQDNGNFTFDSLIIPADQIDTSKGQHRMLEVDNQVVLPVDTNIRVLITSEDVIHSWAVPAFGVKMDGNPGKLNETWMRIEKEGVYYGQCSELCGLNHAFMPIAVRAVSKAEFAKWVAEAQKKYAAAEPSPAEKGTPSTDLRVATSAQ
jgi:cytochrome c oxidase subunit 2